LNAVHFRYRPDASLGVAEVGLQNFQLRDQFWLRQLFSLQFDTRHDVLKVVLDEINDLARALGYRPELGKSEAINLTSLARRSK
jgi:hypothetical protein